MEIIYAVQHLAIGLITAKLFQISESSGPVVHVAEGLLEGITLNVDGTSKVDAFLGVPFAEPPIGRLRFAPPNPPKSWGKSSLYVGKPARACYQAPDSTFKGFQGSEMWNPPEGSLAEDCLYLNIWRPHDFQESHKLAVMVWIFGGGFFYGSPSLPLYNGSVLASTQNVIVVNLNYRVTSFGFLYLDHPLAPGNVGLLDQQAALRWIYNNIPKFGGDPTKITLFGESAGAASTSSHLINPESQKYVSRIILQSGAIINPWACGSPEKIMNLSKTLLKKLNCTTYFTLTRHELLDSIDCLQSKSAKLVAKTSYALMVGVMEFGFGPICQDRSFFKQNALEAVSSGNFKSVPAIIGINSDEGSFWLFYYLQTHYKFNGSDSYMSRSDFIKSVEEVLGKVIEHKELIGAITFHYDQKYWHKQDANEEGVCLNNKEKNSFYRDLISEVLGDYYFVCSPLRFVDHLKNNREAPVYLYFFKQFSSKNPWPRWAGAMHGYEIEYVFGRPLVVPGYTKKEVLLSQQIMSYWATFAKDGKPAHPAIWAESDGGKLFKVLHSNFSDRVLAENVKKDDCEFMANIIELRDGLKKNQVISGSTTNNTSYYLTVTFFFCYIVNLAVTINISYFLF